MAGFICSARPMGGHWAYNVLGMFCICLYWLLKNLNGLGKILVWAGDGADL